MTLSLVTSAPCIAANCWCTGWDFARPQDAAGGLDRFEFRELHRHGDNKVRQVSYVGRSPHEAFFTPDGKEVWVSIRGEDYIAVLDARTGKEAARIRCLMVPE